MESSYDTFVQTLSNTNSECKGRLWTMGDDDVSMRAPPGKKRTTLCDVGNGGSGVGHGWGQGV